MLDCKQRYTIGVEILSRILNLANRKPLLVGLALVLAYCLPFLILGQNIHLRIHDNLDQFPITFTKILSETTSIFYNSFENNLRLFNGNYTQYKGINTEWYLIPYQFLNPYSAYVFLQLSSRLVAFFGMYLLLGTAWRFFGYTDMAMRTGASVLFAILPHYPPAAFTVPMLPMLVWAIITAVNNKKHAGAWTVLLLTPLLTSFLAAEFFLLTILWGLGIVYAFARKLIPWRFFMILAIETLLGVICTYKLITGVILNSQYVSHRAEFAVANGTSLKESLTNALSNFVFGQTHVQTYHALILVFCTIIIILILINRYSKRKNILFKPFSKNALHKIEPSILCLFFGAAIISLGVGLYYWMPIFNTRSSFGFLNMVQWDRFHWLHPLIWYLVLALCAIWVATRYRWGKTIALVTIGLQMTLLASKAEYITAARLGGPTYRAFFAENQFAAIKEFIARDESDYRVVSLGLHPGIALYNGFYCLDGYYFDYSLDYKHDFRKIIKPELDSNAAIKWYFDDYGSRCYFFSHELLLDYLWTKARSKMIHKLVFDKNAFRALGGTYVLSSVKIESPVSSGLRFLKKFENSDSAWDIYLYDVDIIVSSEAQ